MNIHQFSYLVIFLFTCFSIYFTIRKSESRKLECKFTITIIQKGMKWQGPAENRNVLSSTIDLLIITHENKSIYFNKRTLNLKERKLVVTWEKHFFTFVLNSGKDYIPFSVASKTVFHMIGPLLEIAKFVNICLILVFIVISSVPWVEIRL